MTFLLLTQGLDEALSARLYCHCNAEVSVLPSTTIPQAALKNFSLILPLRLPISVGSAPGLLFEEGKKVLLLLQGIPQEMERTFEEGVLPYLRKHVPVSREMHREDLYFFLLREDDVDPSLKENSRRNMNSILEFIPPTALFRLF